MMYTIEKANQFIKQNSSRVESKYRQKIHLQPPLGWMNDPNGFITIGEEIHLFYQYYPYDSIWGPMHWGHAVTRNCISWQYLPVALAPDQKYDEKGCFSGTAILNQEKLLLMYTGGMTEGEQDVQQQCIATSTDYRTFQKVKSNPIISNKNIPEFLSLKDFRDPKIIKRENQFYALVVTKTENNTGSFVLFESHDAVQWVYKSVVLTSNNTFGEMWECPDLLEINGKDILFFSAINMPNQQEKYKNISSCLYFVGSMDWEAGTYTYDFFDEIDAGLDFYAPQTAVLPDGSPLLIAWMQMWDRNIPTHELGHHWAGCMTVIRRLSLINNTLFQKPYIPNRRTICEIELVKFTTMQLLNCPLYFSFNFEEKSDFIFSLSNEKEEISFQKKNGQFILDREKLVNSIKGREENYKECRNWNAIKLVINKIEIVLDTSSIEIFIGNGEKTMSMRFFSHEKLDTLSVTSTGGYIRNFISHEIVVNS